ncbi:unnamed protein product [Lampetra fluviatilis]
MSPSLDGVFTSTSPHCPPCSRHGRGTNDLGLGYVAVGAGRRRITAALLDKEFPGACHAGEATWMFTRLVSHVTQKPRGCSRASSATRNLWELPRPSSMDTGSVPTRRVSPADGRSIDRRKRDDRPWAQARRWSAGHSEGPTAVETERWDLLACRSETDGGSAGA